MQINIRSDSVEISGYVNAVERNSKPLMSRIGRFVERIRKGAFSRALSHSDDVYLLLNHDKGRVLGSIKQGNLELTEDSIGLHARATVTDPEVIESARRGDLIGWSFGFYDIPDGVDNGIDEETKLPLRKLRDLDLKEVSILDRRKSPAYDGTLIMARSEDDVEFWGEPLVEEVQTRKEVDLSSYYDMVDEMYDNLIEKRFNPNHDARGRFTTGSGGGGGGGGGAPKKDGPEFKGGVIQPNDAYWAQHEEEYDKYLDAKYSVTAGRKFGETNTQDAWQEIQNGQMNSLSGNMDENGRLTWEREALHKQIIEEKLEGKEPVEGQATMTMLGGGPASGKSSVMSTKPEDIDKNTVVVDPDDMKKALPNYSEMALKDPNTASYYHEESSALAKRFAGVAESENYNVIYDGTGDGSVNSVQKKINQARENGYRVEGKYVTISTEDAIQRNEQRYKDALAKGENPRLVPEEYVRATHRDVTDILVATAPSFDYTELWDNSGEKGQQKLIATGGGGQGLKAVAGQEQAFMDFLSKGGMGVDGFEFLSDGTVKATDALLADMKNRKNP